MEPRLAFKVGFLRKCAELGLTRTETLAAVKLARAQLATAAANAQVKEALTELVSRPLEAAYDVGGHLLKSLGNLGLATAIAGPPVLGAGLGYGLSRATDISDEDVDAVKKRELIDEYLRQAQRLRRRTRPQPGLN